MEQSIFNAIHNLAGQSRLLDFLGVFLADYLGYLMLFSAVVILSAGSNWRKKFADFSLLAISLIISRGVLTEVIRAIYHRQRPFLALNFTPLVDQAGTGAFPSGHAAFYFALTGVIWMLDVKWGKRFLIGAILMGLARIYAGVHWPLDIVGGAVVGLLSVWLSANILKKGTK